MTDISQVIAVTVNVGDVTVSAAGFGTPLIFSEIDDDVFSERVRSYNSLSDVSADFESTTKEYKAAQALFSQPRAPTVLKIGRRDPDDASNTAALDAIIAEDNDWYCLLTTYKTKSNLSGLASYMNSKKKIFLSASEDSDVLTTATDDIASVIKAAGYNRTAYMWHHQAGVDATGNSYSITDGVATIVKATHGLRVGDPVTLFDSSGESSAGLDGDYLVASVASDGNSFTIETDAADESGPNTVSYFARYTFPECAWAGAKLSTVPGSETWKFEQLAGITPAPRTYLTPAQETRALGKRANLYTTLGGVGHTHEGVVGSGRFIDIQRGIDWMEARLGEALANALLNSEKVPYTDAGGTVLEAACVSVLDQGVTNGLLGPLLDGSGKFYNIFIPKVANQLQADRANRYFPGITIQAQLAGAIHSLAITVNAQI